jgi:hypothetical protein
MKKRRTWGARSNAFVTDDYSYWNMGGGSETPSTATSGIGEEENYLLSMAV